jgi:cysteine desulfurase
VIYFDHNATTPLSPVAREAWLVASERFIGNPSSPHRVGARADAALTDAREQLAAFLGCHALDIVWTSGATESNNAAIHHLARTAPPRSEFWISAIEHPCLFESAKFYFGKRLRLIPVSRSGMVELTWIEKQLPRRTAPCAIAVMAANNETGVLQPWREIQSLCRAQKIPFLCDAAQWVGKLSAAGLGECDFVSGCAHKFGGPKGVGFLKCPAKGPFTPLLRGGPQEEGRRAGTENVAGVLAMLAALAEREKLFASPATAPISLEKLRADFERQILATGPGIEILGADARRLWNTVSVIMPEADCRQRAVVKLDKSGFAVSTGSACASGKEKPSHVLTAMGFPSASAARALRFSSGPAATAGEWAQLARALAGLANSAAR